MSALPKKYKWKYLKLAGREVLYPNENINGMAIKEIIERLMFKKFDGWVEKKVLDQKQ